MRAIAAALSPTTVLEIGTGVGVSGTALLAGMPGRGVLVSIDTSLENQQAAESTFSQLGFSHEQYQLRCGAALTEASRIPDESVDLMFIDGAKIDYPPLVDEAQRVLRPRGLVVLDNALWGGRVADHSHMDPSTLAIREAIERIRTDDRWLPALLSVGDGVLIAVLAR